MVPDLSLSESYKKAISLGGTGDTFVAIPAMVPPLLLEMLECGGSHSPTPKHYRSNLEPNQLGVHGIPKLVACSKPFAPLGISTQALYLLLTLWRNKTNSHSLQNELIGVSKGIEISLLGP